MDFMALFTFDALELNNSPTWFFAALFFIKVISDYINKGILYYIGAIIAVTVICHYLNVGIVITDLRKLDRDADLGLDPVYQLVACQ